MKALFAEFDRWSALAARWLYNVGIYGALPALLGLVTIDVLLRYLANAPLPWGREANGLLLLITLFSALPHAWDRGQHIRMEIVYARLSNGWRTIADAVTVLTATAFALLLAAQALGFSRSMFTTGETGEDLRIPLWPFMSFVAVCALVLAARLVANPHGEQAEGAGVDD